MDSSSSYKLTYLDVIGLAEGIRYIFHANKCSFEDHRLEFNAVEDETNKSFKRFVYGQEWVEIKPSTPFGQIPILTIYGDRRICQTKAILRYVGKQFGMAGKDDYESAQIDMIGDRIDELYNTLNTIFYQKDNEARQQCAAKYYIHAETVLLSLENILKTNNGGDGFFVGEKMSWVDAHFAGIFAYINKAAELFNFTLPLHVCPKLAELWKRVDATPGIAEYISKRPERCL